MLNGTGAGTWRRVVHSGIDASGATGQWTNPNNRTWKIDRSFGFSLTSGQVISITPARARIIFEQDHFLDGGTLQFYGQAQEVVVQSLKGERMTGTVAWGQWRGWYEPPCGTMGMPPCPPPTAGAWVGGEMGKREFLKSRMYRLAKKVNPATTCDDEESCEIELDEADPTLVDMAKKGDF